MNIHSLQSGDKITGLYYGVFFSGTVLDHFRPIGIVILDAPVKVFGMWHYYIKFYVRPDGSSYAVQVWSIQQGRNFYMADRFEQVESDPKSLKLYTEMLNQSQDRTEAMHEAGIWWTTDMRGYLPAEIVIRWSCNVLIRRYTELLS